MRVARLLACLLSLAECVGLRLRVCVTACGHADRRARMRDIVFRRFADAGSNEYVTHVGFSLLRKSPRDYEADLSARCANGLTLNTVLHTPTAGVAVEEAMEQLKRLAYVVKSDRYGDMPEAA